MAARQSTTALPRPWPTRAASSTLPTPLWPATARETFATCRSTGDETIKTKNDVKCLFWDVTISEVQFVSSFALIHFLFLTRYLIISKCSFYNAICRAVQLQLVFDSISACFSTKYFTFSICLFRDAICIGTFCSQLWYLRFWLLVNQKTRENCK